MFNKGYFIKQALMKLGIPIQYNGEDFVGDMKTGDECFQPALDELSNITDIKGLIKRVTLVEDPNKDKEYGMLPNYRNLREFYFTLPSDFSQLQQSNVINFRIMGDYFITHEPTNPVIIEYVGTIEPTKIPNSTRNLFIYILAKHIAIAMRKEEKLQFIIQLLNEEMMKVKINETGNQNYDYFNITLRR